MNQLGDSLFGFRLCGLGLSPQSLDCNVNTANGLLIDRQLCTLASIATWLIVLVYVIASTFHFNKWSQSGRSKIPQTTLYKLKITISLLIAFFQFGVLVLRLVAIFTLPIEKRADAITPAVLSLPAILGLTYVYSACVLVFDRKYGCRCSGLACIFWFTNLVLAGYSLYIRLKTLKMNLRNVNNNFETAELVLLVAHILLVVVSFILALCLDNQQRYAKTEDEENTVPFFNINFVSRITYSWFGNLVWKAFRRGITLDDLYRLPTKWKSESQAEIFDRLWSEELKKKEPALLTMMLFKAYKMDMVAGMALKLTSDILQYCSPLLLEYIIEFVTNRDGGSEPSIWKGLWACVILACGILVRAFVQMHYLDRAFNMGLKIRSAIIDAVYRKIIQLNSCDRISLKSGEVMSMISMDAETLYSLAVVIHNLWSVPLTIIVCMYLLWRRMGPAALICLVVLLVLIACNTLTMRWQYTATKNRHTRKETRLTFIMDIITGIKSIKLFAWELAFEKKSSETT